MFRSAAAGLSLFLAFAVSPVRAADDDPKEIITKALKAHGGEEYVTKHQAMRAQNKGKITLPGVGEAEFTQELSYMLPNKFRDVLELKVGGQTIKITTLANGDDISIDAAGQAVPVDDKIKTSMKDAMAMIGVARLVPLLKDKNYELSLFGDTKIDDKPAVGVRVSAKGKKDITLFFDKKTNLLVKVEHRALEAGTGTEVNEERFVLEYGKGKDGVPQPKKVLVKQDGKTFIEAETVEYTALEKIDESEFKK